MVSQFQRHLSILIALIVIFVGLVLREKRRNPEKSYMIAILNTIFIPFRFFKVGLFDERKITLEGSMQIAIKEVGLSDFGDLTYVERYRRVLDHPSVKKSVFSNLGYLMAAGEWEIACRRRLRLVDFLKKHPEVEKIPIIQPLFIFGIGRSGTTFVHRLLSLDPKGRSPALWELILPCPETEDPNCYEHDRQKRLQFFTKRLESRNAMGESGLEQFHEVGANLPEECLFALSDEIPTIFHHLSHVLSDLKHFNAQIGSNDVIAAYSWYKKLLQVLMYQVGDTEGMKRWVLKCPLHIFWIKELAQVFPDAKLVWAHRHPAPTLTSMCALIRALHFNYYEKDDYDAIAAGKQITDICSTLILKVDEDVKEAKVDCAHVLFENVTVDPVGTIQNVYKQFGWEYTIEYDTILKKYLEENRQQREKVREKLEKENKHLKGKEKGKLHDYKPEDFGLTKKQLSEGPFAEYVTRYNIKSDK